MFIPLTQKYRPETLDELVLPFNHGLGAAFKFVAKPFDSAWLLRGRSGLGKSTLASIMATASAHPLCIRRFVGPDLDSTTVAGIAESAGTGSVFSERFAFIVEEADAIPAKGQIRLLDVLENYPASVWIFTSNEELSEFEPRFLSRLTVQSFSGQGLAEPAAKWLAEIAGLEGLSMSYPEAERIIRNSRNNLRAALQTLQTLVLESDQPTTSSPLAPAPLPVASLLEKPSQTCAAGKNPGSPLTLSRRSLLALCLIVIVVIPVAWRHAFPCPFVAKMETPHEQFI